MVNKVETNELIDLIDSYWDAKLGPYQQEGVEVDGAL